MTLNIDQDEYLGSVAQEAGVRVVVHSQDRMPFPEDEGVSVMPGQITYIGMRLVSRPSVSSASQLLRELFLGCQTLSATVGLITSAEAVGVRSVLAEFLRVSTRLRVLQFTVTRLSDPYGGCVDITSRNKSRNVYEEVYGVKYRFA